MPDGGDRPEKGGGRAAGGPRYALPSNLPGSLRRLDDGQLDKLLQAVVEEARRRGRPLGSEPGASPSSGSAKQPGQAPAGVGKAKRRPLPVPPGQERLIRAAFEAGVKPGAIARQLRLSRAQVEQVVGTTARRAR